MRAIALLVGWILLTTHALAQEATTPDLPTGEATITGTVVHRGSGAAVPDVEVVIYALTPSGSPGLRRLKADASGRFEAQGIAAGGVTYLVGARYDEVSYPGARVSFETGERTRQVEIAVADRSSDADGLSVESMVLRASPAADGLRIVETLTLQLAGDRAVYISTDERAGATPALQVSLPDGASDFQMPLGVIPEGIDRDGAQVRFFGPLYPGRQDLTWSYTVPDAGGDPAQGSQFTLDRAFPDAVGRVEIHLPGASGRVDGEGLSVEEREATDESAPVRVFSHAGVGPGARLAMSVALPPSRIDPSAVRVVEARLIIHHDDAAADVTETHRLEITGDTQVLGTAESPLLHIPIPDGARRLRFGSDGGGVNLVPAPEGGLLAVGSAAPGPVNVEIAYRLPIEAPPFVLTRRFSRRVPLMTVFLADHGTWLAVSDRLHRRRPARTQDLTYAHLEAFEVDPDEAITLRLEPLPARSATPRPALLAGVTLAGLAVAWALVAPLLRGREDREDREDEASQVIPATTRERNFLYEAIRDLEHDFETGKISDEDHTQLRDELRARAAALLAEERAPAPSAPAQASAPARCSACDGETLPQHRFCPSCGHHLDAAPPEPARPVDGA